jgi:hypothetical protein
VDVSSFLTITAFYSISYPFEYDLKDDWAEKGSNITITIDLVSGTTFKILGMMLCEA